MVNRTKIIVQNIAMDFRAYSRRGNRRMEALYNCYNEEDGVLVNSYKTSLYFMAYIHSQYRW